MSLWSLRVGPPPSSHNPPWTGPVAARGHWREVRAAVPLIPLSPIDHGRYGRYGDIGHDMAGMDPQRMGGMDNSGDDVYAVDCWPSG